MKELEMSAYKPYLAMICVHSIYAGMALLTKAALNQGMNHFVFVVYRQATAAVFLTPFALVFERLRLYLFLLITKEMLQVGYHSTNLLSRFSLDVLSHQKEITSFGVVI